MLAIAVNGSPRKKWNTATLLEKALEGAASQGAETELVHLYDLDFKGCVSCFACKTKGGKSYGKCAVRDGITPLLDKIEKADVLLLGAPIYFGSVTGEMRSFMERLMFPYLLYAKPPQSLFPGKLRAAFIYTMNAGENQKPRESDDQIAWTDRLLKLFFGQSDKLCSFDTYQFEDYSKVVAPLFDVEKKAKRRAEVFPVDCANAFEMGARLASEAAVR